MKFNEWSQRRINLGMKRLTSRRIAYIGDPDVDYIVGPLPWKFIKEFLYRDEGAFTSDELQKVINEIFRKTVGPDKMFYVHVLKETEE